MAQIDAMRSRCKLCKAPFSATRPNEGDGVCSDCQSHRYVLVSDDSEMRGRQGRAG